MGLLFVRLVFWARSGPVASAARPLSVPTKRASLSPDGLGAGLGGFAGDRMGWSFSNQVWVFI